MKGNCVNAGAAENRKGTRGIDCEKGVFWQYTILCTFFSFPFIKCKTWLYTAESWAAPRHSLFSLPFLFLFLFLSHPYLLHSSISITPHKKKKHPQFFSQIKTNKNLLRLTFFDSPLCIVLSKKAFSVLCTMVAFSFRHKGKLG